jgi:hypothetical protein
MAIATRGVVPVSSPWQRRRGLRKRTLSFWKWKSARGAEADSVTVVSQWDVTRWAPDTACFSADRDIGGNR